VNSFSTRRLQLGLTLIELMISITIGLVVVGAVTYLYMGSRGAYRGNESLARIQDAGRFALDSIARDIRRAGALGCGTVVSPTTGSQVTVTVVPPVSVPISNGTATAPATAILGFGPASYTPQPTTPPSTWTPPVSGSGPGSYWGGDVLQLQIASGAPVRVIAPPDTVHGTIAIASNSLPSGNAPNFNTGNYALLASCSGATVFQVTANPGPPTSTVQTIGYAPVGGPIPAIASGQSVFSVANFPTLQHFDQVTYYLGKNADSLPALYRYSVNSGKTEELVDNIEDMDVVYGVGVNGSTATGTFKHAGPNGIMTTTDWANVISVRVSVIVRGDQLGAAPNPQTLQFRATDPTPTQTTWTAPDTRLRQVFTVTAAVRDRLQTP
jgi:type IV pilus assembly protein PilW